MTDQDHDDEADGDPRMAELLREVASVAVNPTEDGVKRLMVLVNDAGTPAVVRVRAAATLLDIGYGPAEEGEPLDEDEP